MDDAIILINEFIDEIKKQFSSLHIDYEYNSETDEYNIWHNDRNLELNDACFLKYTSEKAEGILFKNDIYNFCFGYDYYKAKSYTSKHESLIKQAADQ